MRRFGFRKWYARERLSSHAHLLLTVLCSIGMIGRLEVFARGGSPGEKLLDLLLFIASGAIGLWALRRYLYLLMHAEEVATQASCPDCGVYARFDVLGEDRRGSQATAHCRSCTHTWAVES